MIPYDEAFALAQILLGLLLFTVGIPALVVEIRVDESLRRILHKRLHTVPMLFLGAVALGLVVVLIIVSGRSIDADVEKSIKHSVAAVIVMFAFVWGDIYQNVRIKRVVHNIVRDIKTTLRRENTISNPDVADLLTLGENLEGKEKNLVIQAVGTLCGIVQARPDYNGRRLEKLITGLPRIVETKGTLEHHNSAKQVIEKSWQTLVSGKMDNDKDAEFIKNAACTLGSLAVLRNLDSVALRWISTFSLSVVEVPYRIGATAVAQRHYAVAAAALSRLKLSAAEPERKQLSKEFVALVAHFHDAGPSAGRTARRFLDKLNRSVDEVREAARNAAASYRERGDYATADAIDDFLQKYP